MAQWSQPNESMDCSVYLYDASVFLLVVVVDFFFFFFFCQKHFCSIFYSWVWNYNSIVTSFPFRFFYSCFFPPRFFCVSCFVWLFHGLNSWWIEFSGSNTSNNCHFECYWKMIDRKMCVCVCARTRVYARCEHGAEEMKNETSSCVCFSSSQSEHKK